MRKKYAQNMQRIEQQQQQQPKQSEHHGDEKLFLLTV
jgi:hypothetical protein